MVQPNPDKRKILYDAVSKQYDVGSFDEFSKKLDDPNKRRAFYDGVGKQYQLGTFEEFESKVVSPKKKSTPASTAPKQNSELGTRVGLPESPKQEVKQSKYREGSMAWTLDKLNGDNVYNRYKQAEQISDDRRNEIIQEVEDEVNNEGFWNNVKAFGRGLSNFLSDRTFNTSAFSLEETKQAKKELMESKQPVTPESVIERAKQNKINQRLKSERDTQLRSFLKEAEGQSVGDSPMNERERLAIFEAENLKSFQENDKDLLRRQNIVRPALENTMEVIKAWQKDAAPYLAAGQRLPEELEKDREALRLIYEQQVSEAIQLQDEYTNNLKDLGKAEDNLDVFKRDYSWGKNFLGNMRASTDDIVSGLAGSVDYVASLQGRSDIALQARSVAKDLKESGEQERREIMRPIDVENINSLGDFGSWLSNTVIAQQVPIYAAIATGTPGIAAIGASSTGQKFEEMQEEQLQGAEYNNAQMYGIPLAFGATETASALVDRAILKGAARVIRSASEPERRLIAKGFSEKFLDAAKLSGKILKGTTIEATDEAATQLSQNLIDIYAGDKDTVGVWDGVKDAAAAGALMGGIIPFGGNVVSTLAKPFSVDNRIQQATNEVLRLETILNNPELSETAKPVVEKQLSKAETKQKKALESVANRVTTMPDNDFQQILKLEKQQSNLKKSASEIQADPAIDEDSKKLLISQLKTDFDRNENQRLEIIGRKPVDKTVVTDEEVPAISEEQVPTVSPEVAEVASNIEVNEETQGNTPETNGDNGVGTGELGTMGEGESETNIQKSTQPADDVTAGEGQIEVADDSQNDVNFALSEIDKGVTLWDGNPYSGPRINLGIPRADITKGEKDLKAGKVNTAPAKRLVEAFKKAKEQGGYEFIIGSGGKIDRQFVPIEEAQPVETNELTPEEENAMMTEMETLAIQAEEYFNSLDEDTQNEVYETISSREVPEPEQRTESQVDVLSEEKPAAEQQQETAIDRILNQDDVQGVLSFLDGLKLSNDTLNSTVAFAPQAWNAFIEAVKLSVKAGNTLRNAINEAARQLEGEGYAKNEVNAIKNRLAEQANINLEEATALRNSDIAEKRRELGFEPREQVVTKKNKDLVDKANKKIADGYDVESLIDEVLEANSERQLTDEEVVILKQYQLGKEQEIIELGDKIVQATNEGKQTPLDNLTEQRNAAVDALDRAYRAGERAGTITARALNARRLAILYDYSLANMLIQRRKANNNEKLTPEQINSTTEEYNRIKQLSEQLQRKVESLENENNRLKAEKQLEQIIKSESRRRVRKEKVANIDKSINDVLADIKKKAKEQQSRLSVNPIPIEMVPDIARLAVLYAQKGITNLTQVVDNIYNSLQEDIPGITREDIQAIIANYDYEGEAKNNQRLEQLKKRTSRRIEEIKKRLEEKDFSKKIGDPVRLDEEGQKLKDELRKAKWEWEKALEQDRLSKRTKAEKARDLFTNIFNVPRTVMASIDLSAPLRQGLVLTVNNPRLAAKAFGESLRQMFDKNRFDRWLDDVKESEAYDVMKKSGLYLADPRSAKLSAQEEEFMTNFAEKIPFIGKGFEIPVNGNKTRLFGINPTGGLDLIGGSERAYVSYLNKMRVDVFSRVAKSFEDEGLTYDNSPKLYDALADFVNSASGRGSLPILEKSAQVLNTFFFSPRLIASRINLLTRWADPIVPKRIRKMHAKNMLNLIISGTTILALASLAGAEVEKDPRSARFGKIKVGDTYIDIWGGHQQFVRYLAQIITGERKKGKNTIQKLDGKIGSSSRADVVGQFIRSKAAPVPATVWNLLDKKNMVGEEYTWGDVPSSFTPLFARDMYEAIEEEGLGTRASLTSLGVIGVGVQTYDEKK